MTQGKTACPKVTVIIPTYNRSRFICQAVDSVIAQTYPNIELIVVDDGSTDETHDLLKKYGKKLRYLYQKNQGRSAARNLGVKNAKGKYIAFLDSDDLWMPTKLATQVDLIETNTDIALVHCFTEEIDADGTDSEAETKFTQIHHARAFQKGYSYENIALECIIFTSCILIERNIFLELYGFDINFEYLEDWDFYLRLSAQHKIAAVPESLVLYRHHNSQSENKKLTQSRIQVCQKHYKNCQLKCHPQRKKRVLRNLAIHLGESNFILGNCHKARLWFWRMVCFDPSLIFRPIWGYHWLLPHIIVSCLPSSFSSNLRKLKQVLFKDREVNF